MKDGARYTHFKGIAIGLLVAFIGGRAWGQVDLIPFALPLWPIQNTGDAFSDMDITVWRSKAATCKSFNGAFDSFPAKGNYTSNVGLFPTDECDDGDQTLFNGLLCAAGVQEGCVAVRQAQSADGRWHRSPGRRMLWDTYCFATPGLTPEQFRSRCAKGFSPDMGLGVMLYVMETRDFSAYQRWLNWIDSTIDEAQLCKLSDPKDCKPVKWPRLCTFDIGYNEPGDAPPAVQIDGYAGGECSLRPFDTQDFSATNNATLATVPTRYAAWEAQTRVLTFALLGAVLGPVNQLPPLIITSATDKPYFPLHLDAARVLLRMQIVNPGLKTSNLPPLPDPDAFLSDWGTGILGDGTDPTFINAAAQLIAARVPSNPFYQLLAEGPTPMVRAQIVERCPKSTQAVDPRDWLWEKEAPDPSRSMGWDCVFVASLYNRMLVRKDLIPEVLDLMLKYADRADDQLKRLQQAAQVAEGALALTDQALSESNLALQRATEFVSSGFAAARRFGAPHQRSIYEASADAF